jgi:NAD(P)H dehydrogenase (quinone)
MTPSERSEMTHDDLARTRIAVIFYSATGNVRAMAEAVAHGAGLAGAEVRLREVRELSEEMFISQRQRWGRHRSLVPLLAEAELEDLDWADGIAFGSPTRFGNLAAQLKVFLDQAGELWEQGRLANKAATVFTSSQTAHGGQEATILALANTLYHWGAIIVPLGYTVRDVNSGGGNPYGASFTSGRSVTGPDEATLLVARAQGVRLTQVAGALAAARADGSLSQSVVRNLALGQAKAS